MTLANSITEHELWPELQPYVKDEPAPDAKGRQSRIRIEIKGLPLDLIRKALDMQVACARCGRAIYPVRSRQAPPKRGDTEHEPGVPKNLYIAVACPLKVSIGCSRGSAASNEYSRIERSMIAYRSRH